MGEMQQFLVLLLGFALVAVASQQIAGFFTRIKLPMITGLLVVGILAGPGVLGLVPGESARKLQFINDLALAFIAFSVGSELFLRDIRGRMRSISGMTIGQVVSTLVLGTAGVYFVTGLIPFMGSLAPEIRMAVSLLAGTIFIARSPASAMAIISELRARGPFTRTIMGVTVLSDFLVIVLFSIVLTLAEALVNGLAFNLRFILLMLLELMLSVIAGYLLGRLLKMVMKIRTGSQVKTLVIFSLGYGVYLLSHFTGDLSREALSVHIYLEPLLICIIAGFLVTNYTSHRIEFQRVLQKAGPYVYVVFFTLTGSMIRLDVLKGIWLVAVIFFLIRIFSMILGSYLGGSLGKDPARLYGIGWMPYITQAGVSLGLATVITNHFPGWGAEYATVIIAVIIINQLVGPPLFKWSVHMAGESHLPRDGKSKRDQTVFVLGLESQSVALAKQLRDHGWNITIITRQKDKEGFSIPGVKIARFSEISREEFCRMGVERASSMICMLSDPENLKACQIIFEHFGTRELVVRLQKREFMKKFHDLGARIVEPSTAIVSLLGHFVRSPQATSLLLGMEPGQDTIDVEVRNPNLHGMALRNLRLPHDVIILSVYRGGHMIISHGYTRLRKGDIITLVGSRQNLLEVRLRFG